MVEAELKGCPWCGEAPKITKHFKYEMWSLLHRCKIMGPLQIDWEEDRARLVTRWNDRRPAGGENGEETETVSR